MWSSYVEVLTYVASMLMRNGLINLTHSNIKAKCASRHTDHETCFAVVEDLHFVSWSIS